MSGDKRSKVARHTPRPQSTRLRAMQICQFLPCVVVHNPTPITQTCEKMPNLVIVLWGVCTIIHNTMYDRKLTMLGLALLAVTVLLYYMDDEAMLQYAYVTGVAMLAVFLISFIRFNFKYMGSNKK